MEENCMHGNKFHMAGEEPELRAGRRKGQVEGFFIPSFECHSPLFLLCILSLSVLSLCPSPVAMKSHILRAPSVTQVLATALDTV